MCLEKSNIHKNNWSNPFIAQNDIVVYKALDVKKFDGTKCICSPYTHFPIIFDNGKCIMNEPNMEINGKSVNRGIHAYITEKICKKTCDFYHHETGTKKFWAVIPKGSKYFIGKDEDIVSDNLIIFKTREEFRKYKKENKCVNLNFKTIRIMELEKNYFLRNMVDMQENLSTYLKDAEFNSVILEKNIPIVWGDKTPVVFGGKDCDYYELVELDAVNENGTLKDGFKVMTELEFIETFCLSEVVNFIKKKTLCDGVFDGINMVVNTDNTFNNLVNFNNMTDILGIYANMNGHDEPSVLVSSNDDTKKEFIYVSKLPMNIIIKLIEFLEK